MAGSINPSFVDLGGGITKYSIAWTADGSGNVNGNPMSLRRGRIWQVKFAPGTPAPSANYNVTLPDADGVDLLAGKGATLSATQATIAQPSLSNIAPVFVEAQAAINLTVTAAGANAQGRVDIFIAP
jgi:hypothetical protein